MAKTISRLSFACLLALLLAEGAGAGDSLNVRTIGLWSLGGSRAVAGCLIDGRAHALAGSGGRLMVLDISDPGQPLARGELSLTGTIFDISAAGSTAFLAMGDRVAAVDVADPENPAFLGALAVPDSVQRLSPAGGQLYLAAGASGVLVVNASDPAHMSLAGACPTPERAVDVAADGSTCYALDDSAGLLRIDASAPASPFISAQCPVPDSAVALELAGRTAFAASRYGEWFSAVSVVDLDSMSNATTIYLPDRLEDISPANGFLLAACGNSGVHVYDVGDSRDPGEAGWCQTQGNALRVAAADSVAVVGDSKAIMTLGLGGLRRLPEAGFAGQGGDFSDLAISENLAYVADRSFGLRVYDIGDPAHPADLSSHSTPGEPEQVVLSDGRLYLADGTAGLRIYDLADPVNPSLLGTFDTPGTANGLTVLGTTAYIADGDSGLAVIDVSDPANPALSISLHIDEFNARKCAAYSGGSGTWVGLTGSNAAVITVRIYHGVALKGYYPSASGRRIAISGPYMHVLTDDEYLIFKKPSIWSPSTPIYSTAIPSGSGRAFVRKDSLLFTANGCLGLQAQVISKRGNAFGAGHCPTPGDAQAVALSGGHAWLADGPGGLRAVDISRLSCVSQGGGHQLPLAAFGLAAEGDRLYLCDPNTGLRVLDVSDPAWPQEIGYCPLPGPSFGAAAAHPYVFAANGDWGLRTVDVSDPTHPFLAGAYDTAGCFHSLRLRDTMAYVAAETLGLAIISLADPLHPRLVGSYDTPGAALAVALYGDLALVADGGSGLQVINVSDPARPELVSSFATYDCANWVEAHGRYALVADGRAGLTVVDIGDPGAPAMASRLETGGYARQASVRDSICYLACSDSGLLAVNLADPADPQLVGWYRTGNHIWGDVGLGPYQVFSDDDASVRIVQGYGLGRRPPPDYSRWLKVSPNPFDRQARIELLLEQGSRVMAAVYNITGQLVDFLADEQLTAGSHVLSWPQAGTRTASGVYLLRVRAGDRTMVARMILVR